MNAFLKNRDRENTQKDIIKKSKNSKKEKNLVSIRINLMPGY